MPLLFLTEDDRRILQDVIEDFRRGSRGGAGRPTEDVGHQAPECYIARPTSGEGIPVLVEGDGVPDEPGEGDCDIYKIIDGDSGPEIEAVPDFSESVYNLSLDVIPQGWTIIHRTKFGRWVTEPGQQAAWIEFTVDEVPGTGTDGGFTTSDSSVSVSGVVYHSGGAPTVPITEVYNLPASSNYIFEGDEGDKGAALLDSDTGLYWIIQMECP